MPGDDTTQLAVYRQDQVTHASAGQGRVWEALGSLGNLAPASHSCICCEGPAGEWYGDTALGVWFVSLWGRAGAQRLLGTKYCKASASVISVLRGCRVQSRCDSVVDLRVDLSGSPLSCTLCVAVLVSP